VIGENKPPRADYIDGLRAVAILSVMMYHLNKNWFPGGFVGVDIFLSYLDSWFPCLRVVWEM